MLTRGRKRVALVARPWLRRRQPQWPVFTIVQQHLTLARPRNSTCACQHTDLPPHDSLGHRLQRRSLVPLPVPSSPLSLTTPCKQLLSRPPRFPPMIPFAYPIAPLSLFANAPFASNPSSPSLTGLPSRGDSSLRISFRRSLCLRSHHFRNPLTPISANPRRSFPINPPHDLFVTLLLARTWTSLPHSVLSEPCEFAKSR